MGKKDTVQAVDKTLQHMKNVMDTMNYASSYGIIITNSGTNFLIRSFFELFRQNWIAYCVAKESNNEVELDRILKRNGGIVTNGEITLNVLDIVGAVSLYEIDAKNRELTGEPFASIDDFIEEADDDDESPILPIIEEEEIDEDYYNGHFN